MLAQVGWLAFGLLLLTLGADSLQKGGAGLALGLGARAVRVGAGVLILGSALPELAFGLHAARQGAPELAWSVLLARATLNLGLLLGVLHLAVAVPAGTRVAAVSSGAVLLAVLLFAWQSRNGVISRVEGGAALLVLLAVLALALLRAPSVPATVQSDLEALAATRSEHWRSLLRIAVGVAAVAYGARHLFEASMALAGGGAAAIVLPALAMSLPLLASAWFAGWRGFPAVALGLVLGSTLGGLLLVSGVLAFSSVLPVPEAALKLPLPLLLVLAALALAACAWSRPAPRLKGVLLLVAGLAAVAGTLGTPG